MRDYQFCKCWTFGGVLGLVFCFLFLFPLMQTIVISEENPEFRRELPCKLWSLWATGNVLLALWLLLSPQPVSGATNCTLAACNVFTSSSITVLDLSVLLISASPLSPLRCSRIWGFSASIRLWPWDEPCFPCGPGAACVAPTRPNGPKLCLCPPKPGLISSTSNLLKSWL